MFVSKLLEWVTQGDNLGINLSKENEETSRREVSKNSNVSKNQANHPAGEGASEFVLASILPETNIKTTFDGTPTTILESTLTSNRIKDAIATEEKQKRGAKISKSDTSLTSYADSSIMSLETDSDRFYNSMTTTKKQKQEFGLSQSRSLTSEAVSVELPLQKNLTKINGFTTEKTKLEAKLSQSGSSVIGAHLNYIAKNAKSDDSTLQLDELDELQQNSVSEMFQSSCETFVSLTKVSTFSDIENCKLGELDKLQQNSVSEMFQSSYETFVSLPNISTFSDVENGFSSADFASSPDINLSSAVSDVSNSIPAMLKVKNFKPVISEIGISLPFIPEIDNCIPVASEAIIPIVSEVTNDSIVTSNSTTFSNYPLSPIILEADANNVSNANPYVESKQEISARTLNDNISGDIFIPNQKYPKEKYRCFPSKEKSLPFTVNKLHSTANRNMKEIYESTIKAFTLQYLSKYADPIQLKTNVNRRNKKLTFTQTEMVPNIFFGPSKNIGTNPICVPKEANVLKLKFKSNPESLPKELECKKFTESLQTKTSENGRKLRSVFTQTEAKHQSTVREFVTKCVPIPSPINYSLERFVTMKASSFLENEYRRRAVPENNIYGELLVFGCNGCPPPHLIFKMQSKFILRKRLKPNGVVEYFTNVVPKNAASRRNNFTASYCMSNGKPVVVEYINDKNTDMFQIGSSDDSPVDFKVLDKNEKPCSRRGVSRFACRLIVQRNGGHEARVYAGAFDTNGDICLGKYAYTFSREGKMDGFTTNGVYILQPGSEQPSWREVSVCGYIYPLRSKNIDPSKRLHLSSENNILRDGTLIDLCGVTLLWRTPLGLSNTPTHKCLQKLQSLLQTLIPECYLPLPEGLYDNARKHPFVFLCCGHVMRLADQLAGNCLKGWSCPICQSVGPIARFEIGSESGFYFDKSFPSHCFRPCGHATNLKTVQFWSSVKIPEHRNIEAGFCPFCGVKLESDKRYIELSVPQERN